MPPKLFLWVWSQISPGSYKNYTPGGTLYPVIKLMLPTPHEIPKGSYSQLLLQNDFLRNQRGIVLLWPKTVSDPTRIYSGL